MSGPMLAVFLRAVALVETGGDAAAIGARGERGAYAMLPVVVAQHGGHGSAEAAREVRRIERALQARGVDPLPFNVALAWNAGVTGATTGRAPERSYDYARRVVNLMEASR